MRPVGGGDLSPDLGKSWEGFEHGGDVVRFSTSMHFVGTLPVALLSHSHSHTRLVLDCKLFEGCLGLGIPHSS